MKEDDRQTFQALGERRTSMPEGRVNSTLPGSYHYWVISGLTRRYKAAVALEGRDVETGEMWRAPIEPNPSNPDQALPIPALSTVPSVRVVSTDEELEKVSRLARNSD